jgi:sporulation protein YlmC with PRC-barrel domain
MEGTVEDIMLIVSKETVTLTIVKVTKVRAQEMRATKMTSMDVSVKKVTRIVFDYHNVATTIGVTPGQHLPSDITTVIN